MLERVVARLEAAQPSSWVLKGGMALEVRLRDEARVTKDIDLGLRSTVDAASNLHERVVDALTADPDGDMFVLAAEPPRCLGDGAGPSTWRMKVATTLAGKPFGRVQIDVAARPYELDQTERLVLPNSLSFAGIRAPEVDVVDLHRHAAEKLHAMLRDFGDRDNSRVRDLADLVILLEQDLLDPAQALVATRQVWSEREQSGPPTSFPALPESWPDRYRRLMTDLDVECRTFPQAGALVDRFWRRMHEVEEHAVNG